MDPLSITTGIVALTSTCLKTAISLEHVRSKYQSAGLTIAALCSESQLISAALTQMQMLMISNARLQARLDLLETFDTSLTACLTIFSCLEQELEKLKTSTPQATGKFSWRAKARYVWNEDTMKDYLSLLRGQQGSLSFLIQLLQLESSPNRIFVEVQHKNDMLQKQVNRAKSLRQANPTVKIPESVLGVRRGAESLFGDAASSIAPTEFAFDDELVNSKAYRRAMNLARTAVAKKTVPSDLKQEDIDAVNRLESPTIGTDPQVNESTLALNSLSLGSMSGSSSTLVSEGEDADTIVPKSSPSARDHFTQNIAMTLESPAPKSWTPSKHVQPLEFDPGTIAFPKHPSAIVTIGILFHNPNPGPVIFNTMVTNQRAYCVRPNWGVIPPDGSRPILFEKMSVKSEKDKDSRPTRDKFLIQSFAAENWTSYNSKVDCNKKIAELLKLGQVQEVKLPVQDLPDGEKQTGYDPDSEAWKAKGGSWNSDRTWTPAMEAARQTTIRERWLK